MFHLKTPAASRLAAVLCLFVLTSWALAQVVELGNFHLLPPQASIQPPDVQVTRSLVMETGASRLPINFSLSESESEEGCLFLTTDLPWIEVSSDAEDQHVPGRSFGSIEPGQTASLDLVFDSSGLSPGDFFTATVCVVFHQDFTGIDPPPPQVPPIPDPLKVSLQVVQPVEEVPTLSGWSLLLAGVLLLGWGAFRLLQLRP